MAWTTPRTWVTSEVPTAAIFNTHVRDNLEALYGTTSSYTPQVDQGASTNIAKSITEARYLQTGRVLDVWTVLSMSASGTANSDVTVTLPVAHSGHTVNTTPGVGFVFDGSTGTHYACAMRFTSSTAVAFMTDLAVTNGHWGKSPNLAIATTDVLSFHVRYIVA